MIPDLPKNEKLLEFKPNNRGLKPEEFNEIIDNPNKELHIFYNGNMHYLDFLIEQISQFKNENIRLYIRECDENNYICLPFDRLNNNVSIIFFASDRVGGGTSFNHYLLNCNDEVLKNIKNNLDPEEYIRLKEERMIRDEFLDRLESQLAKKNETFDDYSNQQKMDAVFNFVRRNYKYDTSIINSDGSANADTFKYGYEIRDVFNRKKGVCVGRSKLLKLLLNNDRMKVPCYVVNGKCGTLGHMWNEFITDDGRVMEYDLSFGTRCYLEDLPNSYEIFFHELEVEKVLEEKNPKQLIKKD